MDTAGSERKLSDIRSKRPKLGRQDEVLKLDFEAQQLNSPNLRVGGEIAPGSKIIAIKSGGHSFVCIVWHEDSNQIFAAKTFKRSIHENILRREVDIWVKLGKHYNIVFPYFVEWLDDRPFVFMEYVDGGDLSQYIGKCDIPHALNFAIQCCNAMSYASREHSVIHSDIKPANMLVNQSLLKVTDFGIARAITDSAFEVNLTPPLGTPGYRSPEQFDRDIQQKYRFPETEVTVRSDIYSFGASFYELLSGKKPFEFERLVFEARPARLRNVPRGVDLLILKCLEKNPADRFGSFEELKGELIDIYNALPSKQKLFGDRYVLRVGDEEMYEDDLLRRGFLLAAFKKYDKAVAEFDKAISEDGDMRPETLIGKGKALIGLGKYGQAIKCFDEVIGTSSKAIRALIDRGNAKERAENYDEALNCYDKILEIDPRNRLARICRAYVLHKQGKYEQAERCFYDWRESEEILEALAAAFYHKWNSLRDTGKNLEATECFNRSVELDVRFSAITASEAKNSHTGEHHWLECTRASLIEAISLFLTGKYIKAIALCDEALSKRPVLASLLVLKGLCKQQLGEHTAAVHCFDSYLQHNDAVFRRPCTFDLAPDLLHWYRQIVLYCKASSLQELGATKEADDCLSQYESEQRRGWLIPVPHMPAECVGPFEFIGEDVERYYYPDPCWGAKLRVYRGQRLLNVDQGNKEVLLDTASSLLFIANTQSVLEKITICEKVIEYSRKVLELEPDNSRGLSLYGDALAELKEYNKAFEFYSRARAYVVGTTDEAYFLTKLGDCLSRSGRGEESIAYYDKAIEADNALPAEKKVTIWEMIFDDPVPDTIRKTDALVGKAMALARISQYEQALSCYDDMLNLRPKDGRALIGKAYVLAKQGKRAEAVDAYSKAISTRMRNFYLWIYLQNLMERFSWELELDGNDSVAWLSKAVIEEKCGAYKNADDSYSRFLSLAGDEAKELTELAHQRIKALELERQSFLDRWGINCDPPKEQS